MRTLRMMMAGLVASIGVAVCGPASAGGWDHDDYGYGYYGYSTVYVHHHVVAPRRYVHVYHVRRPAPRHVHVIAYEHPGYYAYSGYAPYAYGVYRRPSSFYRSYYPVRTVYPVRYQRRHHWH